MSHARGKTFELTEEKANLLLALVEEGLAADERLAAIDPTDDNLADVEEVRALLEDLRRQAERQR